MKTEAKRIENERLERIRREAEKHANQIRLGRYYRRVSHWLKDNPTLFKSRLDDLDARYCKGNQLRRLWRALWHNRGAMKAGNTTTRHQACNAA